MDKIKNKKMFGIEFEDSTSYYGTASLVSSVSKQEYLIAAMLVKEIVLDMTGSSLQLRIYNVSPANFSDINQRILSKKLPDHIKDITNNSETITKKLEPAQKVVNIASNTSIVRKEYPLTTHSKTLEFVISSPDELDALYDKLLLHIVGQSNNQSDSSTEDESNSGLAGKLYKIQASEVSATISNIINN